MDTLTNFCQGSANIWQIVGYFLLVFKIVIPIIIIILGMIDLGKAVVSNDEKAVQKAAKSLLMRIVAGIAIFFVPTIVGVIMNLADGFRNDVEKKWTVCKNCVVSPGNASCGYYVCLSSGNTEGQCKADYPNH